MDALGSYLSVELLKSLGEGNLTKFVAYLAIFLVLWLEVRGLKKQLKILNETISNSFAQGEKRFETIENDVHSIRLDLNNLKIQGGLHGKGI
jgi:hypothetical protein